MTTPRFLPHLLKFASLALVLGVLAACSPAGSGTQGRSAATAEHTTLEVTVEELGIVEATRVLNVESPFSGRVVTILESGTTVKKGDVVAVLDTRDIEERLEDQIESLKSTKKELEGVMEQLQISLRNNLLDVSSANAQLDLARVELENVNLNLADLEYLHSQQLVAEDSLRDASSQMRRSQIQTFTQDLNLRSQVTGSLSSEKSQEVRVERIGLRGQEALSRINESSSRLESAQIRAPVDGIFLRHSRWNWQMRRNVERQVGESVGDGELLGRIPDLETLVVQTQVPESEMLRLEEGLDVEVTFQALGGLTVPGKVTFIAAMAMEREAAPGGQVTASGEELSGEKVFEIAVTLLELDPRIRPGLTARARIVLERQEDLLTIPIQAVSTRDGKHYVQALAAGRPEQREIRVGRSTRDRVEVLEGLSLGDRVLIDG